MKRRGRVAFVCIFTVLAFFCYILPASAYQLNAIYTIKLKNGQFLEGKLLNVDASTVTVLDSTQTKQTIKRSEIVQANRIPRTYTLEDLQNLPRLTYESNASSDKDAKVSRTYGGKSEEYWITETVRLALKSKKIEDSYDRLTRVCRVSKDQAICSRANQTLTDIEKIRKEYNQLLVSARQAAAPIDWLETHYKWIRWGQEWKN
jgi:small nuclear ribonucleoprotein (snRNP)-like protein